MPPLPIYGSRPCVLLTNDDGPPSASSPNIFGFCKLLKDKLGWDVKVVIPDSQKSWVGKAYAISDIITLSYFYPLEPDGLHGETSPVSRPLKDGEEMEWVMLSGTPASCSNIALHNLYPGQIDLVISGPNHGRNTSTAFALSSGTLGAALGAVLAVPIPGPSSQPSLHIDHIPAIALSYGVVKRPVDPNTIDLAHDGALDVCERLWNDWGNEDDEGHRVQVYSVNVPLVPDVLEKAKRKVVWTRMRRNAYGPLFQTTKSDPALNWWANSSQPNQPSDSSSFKSALQSSLETVQSAQTPNDVTPYPDTSTSPPASITGSASQSASSRAHPPVPPHLSTTSSAGPGAMPSPNPASPAEVVSTPSQQQRFHFSPSMQPLLFPPKDSLPKGTDAWAFSEGYISVTPLKAEFAGLAPGARAFGSQNPQDDWAGRFWDV